MPTFLINFENLGKAILHPNVLVAHDLINQLINMLAVLINSFSELRLTLMYILLVALGVRRFLIQNFILKVDL